MKYGVLSCLVTFVVACAVMVLQLWFEPFEAETFTKLMITLAVVFAVLLGITLVRREYLQDEKLRASGHLE